MTNARVTLADLLAAQVRRHGDAVAMIDARGGVERRLTFAELEREARGAAAWLQARGLRKGSAVLVFVPMSLELYIALLAMFRLGVVALFLDPSAGRTHLEQCCARWAPDALLAIPKAHLLRVASAALRRIPLKMTVGGWVPGAARWPASFSTCNDREPAVSPALVARDPALVTFTSGSTGVPKAAVRTHEFLLTQHQVLAPHLALEAGEIDLATLPIFALANLASGVTTLIPDVDLRRPGEIDPARIFSHVERYGVTRLTASPAFFERLVAHGQTQGKRLPGLRKLHTGGAPVFPRLLDALAELAPAAEVVAVYGSTEAEPIAHVDVTEISAADRTAMQTGRGLLAGRPVSEIKLRILRDRWGAPRGKIGLHELDRETLPAGEPGEIVVAGGHVLGGYLGGVGDDETKFSVDHEVWHRTGDAGLLDDHGRVWLLGRCAARIDDAHGRLYPFTVECVAMTFPEVRRAAVIRQGQERLLVIEADGERGALEERLREATAWAHVSQVRFLDKMPLDKRHNAKIDYPALRRILDPANRA